MSIGASNSFSFVLLIFPIVFCILIGAFVFAAVKGIKQWHKNNNSPRLNVPAAVVSKRADVSSHMHNTGSSTMHNTHSTTYYVTFEVESGDRMELHVDGKEYGMLAEGDVGMLSFQGTRYLGFERDRNDPTV